MVEWIWDPAKNEANQRKHGLSLALGRLVLLQDRLALSLPDPHPDGHRWRTLGRAGGMTTLFVVHTEPMRQADGSVLGRIISVRKATAHERRAYEDETP